MRKLILVTAISSCLSVTAPSIYADDMDRADFSSSERLTETLLSDDKLALEQAQTELDNAVASGAMQEEIAALQLTVDAASANLLTEQTAISGQITQLSDEQIFALNRSLNNAVSSKLDVNIDASQIQSIIEGNYDARQINALTKALEEEAKFTGLADKFDDKYQNTGDEKFLEHSERMLDKADSQKEKFLDKIDRFEKDEAMKGAAIEEAKQQSKQAGKESIHESMKEEAKNMAKDTSRSAAKQSAKEDAKDAAKQAAKQIVKEEGRQAAKNQQKEENKKHGKSKD
ncbi:MAG: hypothetical protein ACU836_14415 [Gammaproteobacteria bacterium]